MTAEQQQCGLCEGTGKRLHRNEGGMSSRLVDCFACEGTGRRGGAA